MTITVLDAIDPTERSVITFDFSRALSSGEVLTAPITVTVSQQANPNGPTDASPALLLQGNNGVDSTGTLVLVAVRGRVDGVDYLIKCAPTCSNALKAPVLSVVLPVREGG